MATITLRNVKGSPLTHAEVDNNFSSLKIGADIAEAGTSDNNPNTLVKRDAAGKATLSTLEATQDVITNSIGQSAAQQHTVPAVASDTLTLNAATQTLTNKSITSPTITGTVGGDHTNSGQVSFTNATAPIISARIGPSSTQQHSVPAVASDTLTLNAATQTLTNKTLTAPVVTGGSINNTPIGATTPNTGAFTTVSATGNATVTGDVAVNGGDLTTTSTTFNLVDTNATTVNFARAATSLTVGANSGTFTVGNPTVVGTQASQALFNTVATSIDFAGAATTLNIAGVSTAAKTVNIAAGATVSGSTKTVNIGQGGAAGSTTNINLGTNNGGTTSLVSPSVTYSGEVTTSSTSALQVPVGTTAQQPVGANGKIRYNTTLNRYEGYSAVANAWGALGGGATGGGADQVFIENSQVVTSNYTITSGKSASSTGPITINNGVTVTIPSGSRWVIL